MHHPLLVIAHHFNSERHVPPKVLQATLELIKEAQKTGYNPQLEFAHSVISKKLKPPVLTTSSGS